MSRQRFIDPGVWSSAQVVALSHSARLLFIGIITTADDYGVCKAHPGLLKADIFPLDEDHRAADVAANLDKIIEQGLAVRWTADDGVDYLFLPGWDKYQSPKYKAKRKLPEPPEELTKPKVTPPLCGPERGHNRDNAGTSGTTAQGRSPIRAGVRGRGSGSGSGSTGPRREEAAAADVQLPGDVVSKRHDEGKGKDTPRQTANGKATASLKHGPKADEATATGTPTATAPLKGESTASVKGPVPAGLRMDVEGWDRREAQAKARERGKEEPGRVGPGDFG